MDDDGNLILFGASTRAAAFSALRAGLRPWCADLFADADLQTRCPAMRLPGPYPEGFLEWIGAELPGPWMYTGGLENRPWLVERMARRRTLWGNDCPALLKARNPAVVYAAVRAAGLPAPAVHAFFRRPPAAGRWLVKPIWGLGDPIHFWTAADVADRPSLLVYLQEYVEGESQSAVYLRRRQTGGVARRLASARRRGLAARRPVPLLRQHRAASRRRRAPGGAGEDWVRPWPAAAAYAVCSAWMGWSATAAFLPSRSIRAIPHPLRCWNTPAVYPHWPGIDPRSSHRARPAPPAEAPTACVGKAVYFAPCDLTFPAEGPWADVLRTPPPLAAPPAFADIPHPGTHIKAGRPVLTFFARGGAPDVCLNALRRTAADLDRRFFDGRPAAG